MLNKTLLFGVAMALALAPYSAVSAADELETVKKEVLKQITVQPAQVKSPALEKVFTANFYKVKIVIKGGMSTTVSMAMNQGKAVKIEQNTTNMPMPVLQSILKKDFKLKTEADAKVFEEALDKLYPVSNFGRDSKLKQIKKTEKGWTFIRGKFFKNLKGFKLTTDGTGSVTAIDYSLEIKP